MGFNLTSRAFKDGSFIPSQYTCDGQDISPPLKWTDIPAGTQSFVLIVDDTDAPVGDWVHWIVINIPENIHALEENLITLPSGATQGMNSWKRNNYGGPCPPSGTHRYFFKLYALNTSLDVIGNEDKVKVEKLMQGHVIKSTKLMGKYTRGKLK